MHKKYTLHDFSEFLRSKPDNFRFKKCEYRTTWSFRTFANADYLRHFWCHLAIPNKRFSDPYYYLYSDHEIDKGQNSLKAIDDTTKLIMMDFSNIVQTDLHDKKSITALRLKQHLASAVKASIKRLVSANFY